MWDLAAWNLYEQYKTAYDVARSSLRAVRESFKKAQSGARKEELQQQEAVIQVQESAVESARSALSDTELRAPFDGVVADTFADNHQFVQAKQTVLSLQNLKNIKMVVHVPEGDVVRMKGKKIDNIQLTATLDVMPGRGFPVRFREFSPQAAPSTQTYQLTVIMPYPEGVTILPGMTVTLKASSVMAGSDSKLAHLFAVPEDAVFADQSGNSCIWLYNDGMAHKTPVKTGSYIGDRLSITGEIKTGDVVVIAGVHFLLHMVLVIAIAGLISYFKLGKLQDLDFTIKTAVVTTIYPGATAQ